MSTTTDPAMTELAQVYLENLIPEIQVALFNLTRAIARLAADEKAVVLAAFNGVGEAMFDHLPAELAGPTLTALSRIDELLVAIHGPSDPNRKAVA